MTKKLWDARKRFDEWLASLPENNNTMCHCSNCLNTVYPFIWQAAEKSVRERIVQLVREHKKMAGLDSNTCERIVSSIEARGRGNAG